MNSYKNDIRDLITTVILSASEGSAVRSKSRFFVSLRMTVACYMAFSLLVLTNTPTYANTVEQFKTFISTTKSGKAQFSQLIRSKDGTRAEKASGTFMFARPGKFRWVYEKPYEQLIVSDGEKLWIYDKDLNQVTVKKLSNALGASPAAILTGDNNVEKSFSLKEIKNNNARPFLEAIPKAQDTNFEWIHLMFENTELTDMELYDHFGQMTELRFTKFERNPKLPSNTFKFTPPSGVDVIGD